MSQQIGYIELLRQNRDFRNLTTGRFISQIGDWFNSVALFTLLLSLTGSGESVAIILIIKLLPTFFFGPLAGVVADRFNRKTIMIAADLLRGLTVLGFLFIHNANQVWLVYLLTILQVVLSTFFEPAESAAVPNLIKRKDLVTANALASASWSFTLALGAALGGFVTDLFGRNTAFVIDALSFFISALFIIAVRIPSLPTASPIKLSTEGDAMVSLATTTTSRRSATAMRRLKKLSFADISGLTDMIEGARYLKSNRRVVAVLLVKSGWGIGGGVLLLLTIFGKQVFPIGRDGSASIGILYACRGFGALIGPMVARAITSNSTATMRRTITAAFFISALFYILFATSPLFVLACISVIGAHAGGSIQWVFSTVLLQAAVPNRFLGRVFALEQSLLTLTMAVSTYLTGWSLDKAGFSARQAAGALAVAFLIPGIAWWLTQRRLNQSDDQNLETSHPGIEVETAD
ncbi:MAG: MFS transporter [Acidobacteria bacterium]|nr:MFS transporter [Acidobacteriota bacterium]